MWNRGKRWTALGVLILASLKAYAGLVIDAGAPASAPVVSNDAVLFDKSLASAPLAAVVPRRAKELQCWGRSGDWSHRWAWEHDLDRLPGWGWTQDRWCSDGSQAMAKMAEPLAAITRWSLCEVPPAQGSSLTVPITALCAAPFRVEAWASLGPRVTVYSLGDWTVNGKTCPAALLKITPLLGAVAGSTGYEIVPLEGACPWIASPIEMERVWLSEAGPVWIQGYDGRQPYEWTRGWVPVAVQGAPADQGTRLP